jgi:polygalacturonase
VHDVVYEDVCIKDTKNPIYMDSNYSYRGSARDKLPEFKDITLHNVWIFGAGKITLDGFDPTHRLGIAFNHVMLQNPAAVKITADHAVLALGPGKVNFLPKGEDVKVIGQVGQIEEGTAAACAEKFVPYPE